MKGIAKAIMAGMPVAAAACDALSSGCADDRRYIEECLPACLQRDALAAAVDAAALSGTPPPRIISIRYSAIDRQWVVKMEGAATQYVSVMERDGGKLYLYTSSPMGDNSRELVP